MGVSRRASDARSHRALQLQNRALWAPASNQCYISFPGRVSARNQRRRPSQDAIGLGRATSALLSHATSCRRGQPPSNALPTLHDLLSAAASSSKLALRERCVRGCSSLAKKRVGIYETDCQYWLEPLSPRHRNGHHYISFLSEIDSAQAVAVLN
jgi:hypothetical protein